MLEENGQEDLFPEEEDKEETLPESEEVVASTEEINEGEQLSLTEDNKNISSRDLTQEMKESYIDYAMSVIIQRALPDVRDGLKPVHRRILYSMHQLGINPGTKHKKSARLVGDVMGNYHPHGDSSIYGAIVRMAQDFSMRYPLVDGQGNFGSVDGDNAAAMRYTEVRMAKITPDILADIEKDTVDFVDNYDASQKEPTVLPSRLPFILLNGVGGIAVGMATNIPPHNLAELVDGTIAIIENPEITTDELLEYIPGPDFPTGGTIYDHEEIRQAYATGRGKIVTRGQAEIVEGKNGRLQIIISEIPFQVNKSTLLETIADLAKEKRIIGIADLRDESDRTGMRVVVDLKREAFPKKVLNQLYKMTQLQESFHVNMIALVGGVQPKLMNIKEILEHYIVHRQEIIVRRCRYELRIAEQRAHILEGLKIALDNIDAVINTIRKADTKEEAHKQLMEKFSLSEKQAQAILEMRLQQLAGLERKKIEDEYLEKMRIIGELKEILANPALVLGIIKKELIELKEKFGDKRRTRIVKESLSGFKSEDLIPNVPTIVTITEDNYIKRLEPSTYKAQNRGGKGIIGMTTKQEDIVDKMLITKTHNDILFFTNKGRVFQLKAYEVPQASRTAKGNAAVNLVQLTQDEKIITMIDVAKEEELKGKYLKMVTKNGIVKKTDFDSFKNVRKSGLIAIKIRDDDELRWVRQTSGSDNIMLVTRQGQSIKFFEGDVRPMGRTSMGVRGIRLKKDNDEVITMHVIKDENDLIITISERGLGKLTAISKYKLQKRGGSGIKTHLITEKGGLVAGAGMIARDRKGDAIVVSEKGQVIRLPLSSISILGRATQGVKIMRFKNPDDKVACLALYDSALFEEEAKIEKETSLSL